MSKLLRFAPLLILTVVLLLLLNAGSSNLWRVTALQGAPFNPHGNYSASTSSCMTCHQPHVLVTDPETACYSCHPTALTHKQNECATCHEPHAKTDNAALIQKAIFGKEVRFDGRRFDGGSWAICETCHTTTNYHSTSANKTHYEDQDCTRCHPHTDGFYVNPQSCRACHGTPPGNSAHSRHEQADIGLDNCTACHPKVKNWTDKGHYNGWVNMADNKDLNQTAVCNDCHGTPQGVLEAKSAWRANREIEDCTGCHNSIKPGVLHGKTAPAVDQFWAVNGHGAASGVDCQSCHNPDAPHFTDASNPRLLAPPNELCARCHADSSRAGMDVSAHGNQAFDAATQDPFVETCVNCHNAHGSSNLSAIRPQIRNNPVAFLARTGEFSFDPPGDNNANDLCATCHTTTAHNRNPSNWNENPHFEGADCTSCHRHETDGVPGTADAFMPVGGCDACHGTPPPPASRNDYPLNENLTPHLIHAGDDPGQYGLECSACHNDAAPGYSGHITSPPSFQDVFFDSLNPGGSYDRTSRTCATVGCHSNGAPSTGQLVYKNPVWAEGATLTCAGCHNDQTNLTTGSHGKHLTPNYKDRGDDSIGCFECHSVTAQNNNNDAVANIDNHVDFQKQVAMNVKDVFGRIDNSAFRSNDLTCANSLCHSDGAASREQPGTPKFSTPLWGNAASGTCGTCHGVNAQDLTSGAHARHFDSSNQGPGIQSCNTCHSNYPSEDHVNGKVNFADGKTLSSTAVCNDCHSAGGAVNGVAEAKSKWSSGGALSCEGCHDNAPAMVKGVPAPNVVGDGSTYGFAVTGHGSKGFACITCHQKGQNSIHFDGVAQTYKAAADNYQQALWLNFGGLNVPITDSESYQKSNYALCYTCHLEPNQVGMGPGYSNALFTHSNPPPAGYPLQVDPVITSFRNESAQGFYFGNVPANIHWDHLDMNQLAWDSDGDGTKESKPSCVTCHDPHGVKSTADGVNYPAMTYADIGITHGQDATGAFGQVTKTGYTNRCNTCHPSAGIKYYRPQ
ncbi:MAG: CxxxxCH/CxxCH domain-containing protein [Caldilineales bacterium]|nr:CxxxxCH/CxxCH domain-containing protein [Caldilineales bacterium]